MNKKIFELDVLYVEDDLIVRDNTADTLSYFFKNITLAQHGKEALEHLQRFQPDVLITDYVMPYMNGYTLIVEARKLYPKLITFITSSYTDQDKLLKCIPLGISDYIIKPLDYHKLSKVVQTIGHLINEHTTDVLIDQMPCVTYSQQSKTLCVDDKKFTLSKQESDLIELLIEYRGRVLSKEMMKNHLYGSWDIEDNVLKNLLYRLRKKISVDMIKTIKNIGYILE